MKGSDDMMTSKSIINKLKNEDLDAALKEIQVFLKDDGKIACSDVCDILKAVYHLLSAHEHSTDNRFHIFISDLIPIFIHCAQNSKNNFTPEDLSKHQFFKIFYHIIRICLNLDIYSPALASAECMRQLLHRPDSFIDKEAFIQNLYAMFWNEARKSEGKNNFIDGFHFRCKSIEFHLLYDTSKIHEEVSFALRRYCQYEGKRESATVLTFLQNVWTPMYQEVKDYDHCLILVKNLYFWLEILSRGFKNDNSIFHYFLSRILDISNSDLVKSQKQSALKICLEVLKTSFESLTLKQDVPVSKSKLKQFEKLLTSLKHEKKSEVELFAYTLGIFYLIFVGSFMSPESYQENSVYLTKSYFEFCIFMTQCYLDLSSTLEQKDLPFSLQLHTTISYTVVNLFGQLIKSESDIMKKSDFIKAAENFVKYAVCKLKLKISKSPDQKLHSSYGNSIGNVGLILYSSGLYSESFYFLEASCDVLSSYELTDYSSEDAKRSLWKKREVLIYSYYFSSNYQKALEIIVQALVNHPNKMQECMNLWFKVKRAAARVNDLHVISSTISDLLLTINADVSVSNEITLLFEELKGCKFERCSLKEEIIAIVKKLQSLQLENIFKARFLLEVLTLPPSIQEEICTVLNLSVLEVCHESINLYKKYLGKNRMDNKAKLELSVVYFWLYQARLQMLHKFIEKERNSSLELLPEEQNDMDENDVPDITPAFSLVTCCVEMDLLQHLEAALESWTEISRDTNQSWKELSETVKDRDLLTVINATAEIFSTSVHNIKELKCWVLLRNIACIVENKEEEYVSSIAIIQFLIRFGYFEAASQLLKHVETALMSQKDCTNDIQVLKLKFQLTQSQYCLHTGKFDKGLLLLEDILNNPILEKHFKSTKMLEVDSLLLKIQFLLVPPKAYAESQSLKYFQGQTAITSALEGAALAKGLLKSISEKGNTDNYKNDWMPFKFQLLKNIVVLYLKLGELHFQIGEVRFARCYLKEGLKLSQENLLTYWTSKILLLLGQIDLLCDSPKDCLVKLNELKYIMDENSKDNASWLLSKIKEVTVAESLETSDNFSLENKVSLNFRQGIRQHFTNNSDVLASPVQKKKGKTLEFEVKPQSGKIKHTFSYYIIKLEIWILNCLQLITEGEMSVAESQLKKLLKICKKLNEMFTISDILASGNLGISSNEINSKVLSGPEVVLPVLVLLKLSLVQMAKKDFGNTKSSIEEALGILNQSLNYTKYLHSNLYGLLHYYKTLVNLKNIMFIKDLSSVDCYACPSIKGNVFVKKNPKLEKLYVCQTPPRAKQVPKIVITDHRGKADLCNAPMKKDILPAHISDDLKRIEGASKLTPLVFSSSDDDFTLAKTTKSTKIKNLNTVVDGPKNELPKTTFKLFKSKNSKVDIKSACDIWKHSVTTTPKGRSLRSYSGLNTRQKEKSGNTRMKNKCSKSDTSVPKPLGTKASKKTKQSCPGQLILPDLEVVEASSVISDVNFHSPLKEQMSIEYNRGSAEKKTLTARPDSEGTFSQYDEVFQAIPEVCSSTERMSEAKSSSLLDELCQDVSSLNITKDTSEVVFQAIPEKSLKEFVTDLEDIQSLVQNNAPYPLYPNICKLLAILMMAETVEKKETEDKLKEIGFLLSQTVSSTLGQTYLNNILYSKSKGEHGLKLSFQNIKDVSLSKQMDNYINPIPKDWTVVQINTLPDKDSLSIKDQTQSFSKIIITQYQSNLPPTIVCVQASSNRFTSSLFSEFDDIILQSTLIMKNTDSCKKWWQTRSNLDARLKGLLNNMESSWLGCWKGLLLGIPVNETRKQQILKSSDVICEILPPSNKRLLQVLLDSASFLTREQVAATICHLWNCTPNDEIYSKIYKSIAEEIISLPATERNPVVLLLDKNIQALPWENIPILNGHPVSRMPSLAALSSQLHLYTDDSPFHKGIDCSKTFYVLNPGGDLANSQKTFEYKFKSQKNWKGVVAKPPQCMEYASALKENDLFLYCGHGSGRQYLSGVSSNKLDCHAAQILMGCSSGRLKQLGKQLEPHGCSLMYLMSGSPCVVGNLWDVTDKDIDRFTNKFLDLTVPNYCEKDTPLSDAANAVSQARNACKLRYLVGAAPVIYGFPIFARR